MFNLALATRAQSSGRKRALPPKICAGNFRPAFGRCARSCNPVSAQKKRRMTLTRVTSIAPPSVLSPATPEVTPAHFYIAWVAHEGKNFNESSRLLTEHVAVYAGNNTDFRGKSAYWAARDSERAGKLAEARAIYQGIWIVTTQTGMAILAKQRIGG